MPRPLRPPCRVDMVSFPVFGMCWYGNPDPMNGISVIAYCGGGGSAKTGVNNCIFIKSYPGKDPDDIIDPMDGVLKITTGDQVGVAITVYENPVSHKIWLIVAMADFVQRYCLILQDNSPKNDELNNNDEGEEEERVEQENSSNSSSIFNDPNNGKEAGKIKAGSMGDSGHPDDKYDGCNAIAINAMTDRLAIGNDSGIIKIFDMSDDKFGDYNNAGTAQQIPLFVLEGHTKTICAMSFSMRGYRLVSSAKDGTARLWSVSDKHDDNNSRALSEMKCDIKDPKGGPPPKRAGQVLVRGCAFGDLDGKVMYTVASARRGKAFLSRWMQATGPEGGEQPPQPQQQQQQPGTGLVPMICVDRTDCSPVPISAMSLSQDGGLLVLGSVSGSIILWGIEKWKPLRKFEEVHDLPVTCIAARPYPIPLGGSGEEELIQFHAISASADSRMGMVTLQRRVPKKNRGSGDGGPTIIGSLFRVIYILLNKVPMLVLLGYIGNIISMETQNKCLGGEEVSLFNAMMNQNHYRNNHNYDSLHQCIQNEVIIAPDPRRRRRSSTSYSTTRSRSNSVLYTPPY